MKRFHFPLERVLKLRHRRDRAARVRLAAAMAQFDELGRRAERIDAAIAFAEAEAASTSSTASIAVAYRETLMATRRIVELERTRASAGLQVLRDEWTKAHREFKSLERLRELRREEHAFETQKLEQSEIEELARVRRSLEGVRA